MKKPDTELDTQIFDQKIYYYYTTRFMIWLSLYPQLKLTHTPFNLSLYKSFLLNTVLFHTFVFQTFKYFFLRNFLSSNRFFFEPFLLQTVLYAHLSLYKLLSLNLSLFKPFFFFKLFSF